MISLLLGRGESKTCEDSSRPQVVGVQVTDREMISLLLGRGESNTCEDSSRPQAVGGLVSSFSHDLQMKGTTMPCLE